MDWVTRNSGLKKVHLYNSSQSVTKLDLSTNCCLNACFSYMKVNFENQEMIFTFLFYKKTFKIPKRVQNWYICFFLKLTLDNYNFYQEKKKREIARIPSTIITISVLKLNLKR